MRMKWAIIFVIIVTCLMRSAFASSSPLPADQAFVFSAHFSRSNEIRAQWQIASGYYLYSKKMHFTFEPQVVADISLPQGEYQYDKDRGRYEAFSGNLSVPILFKTNVQKIQMNIDYQGCSQDGFCYPPMHQSLSINLPNQTIITIDSLESQQTKLTSLLTNQNDVNALLHNQSLGMMLLIFIGLGLLLTLTPCVWPMVPILATIIVGQQEQLNTKRALCLSILYVLGAALIYALAGLAAASLGNSIQVWLQQPWMITIASLLFVLLAFSLFGYYDLQLPRHWQNRLAHWNRAQQGGSYTGAFLMGAISTLIVSPCVTAPLVGVLMYIAHTGDRLLGASALFAMGIGMGLPLIAIGISAGRWLPKSGPWMDIIKKFFGVLMLAMAIWLFSRIASPTITILLSVILLLGIMLFLVYYLSAWGYRLKLFIASSVIIGTFAGITTVGVQNTWLHSHANQVQSAFITIRNAAEFNKQLQLAQSTRKPVVLDFYADWCESCVIMDKRVFRQADVKQALTHYILLRADLSNNTVEDEVLLKLFNVVAPPTVLFFNANGEELASQRIVGEISATEFLQRLTKIKGFYDSNTCDATAAYQKC